MVFVPGKTKGKTGTIIVAKAEDRGMDGIKLVGGPTHEEVGKMETESSTRC